MSKSKLAYSVVEVCQQITCGKTKVYELIAAKKLDARKIGRRTIVTGESLERLIAEGC